MLQILNMNPMNALRNLLMFLLLLILTLGCAEKEKTQYFVFLNTNPQGEELPETEVQALQEQHIDNIDRLAAAGELVASGLFEGGGGMMILETESEEAAWELVNTDPAVQAGSFIAEVLPVSFIKGYVCPWWVPVNMGTYGFFRFRVGPNYNPELVREHFYLLSVLEDEPEVLVQADFDDKGSGILILDRPLSDEWIERVIDNPAIQEGALEVDIKNLRIAQGTFCD